MAGYHMLSGTFLRFEIAKPVPEEIRRDRDRSQVPIRLASTRGLPESLANVRSPEVA